MINILLNIITYQDNDKKIMIYFSKMCYDVHNHHVKFQLRTPSMHEEMKSTNYIKGYFEQMSIVWR